VVLVDARFLAWVLQIEPERQPAALPTPGPNMLRGLDTALRQSGLELDWLRTYWYSDEPQRAWVDDVVQRPVQDAEVDGGQSLVRAMAADLSQLAAHHAVEHVLLVTDDERLLQAVDEAQLGGLSVHMLTDEAGADFEQLTHDDPSWARLLGQADRRVVLGAAAREQLLGHAITAMAPGLPGPGGPMPTQDTQGQISAHLQAWWDAEPETQQLDLRDELQFSRSIPQEVDRQLLLSLSRALGHPLTWPEKKIMRDQVRRLVLGDAYTPFSSRAPEALPAE
jgi:hypothetical protein